jgi:hypothetical protein
MRVGGPNPIDNLTRAATELNTVAGAKINMDTIKLKLDVATGKAFVPDSQRYKNIEDVTKNINTPVALLMLNSCSTVLVSTSVSPNRLL